MKKLLGWFSIAVFLSAVLAVSAQTRVQSKPVRPQPTMHTAQTIFRLAPELSIDKVQRTGPPPATVFVPPSADVLYDSAPVTVSFTLTNPTGQPLTGRITGNFGGLSFPASYPVNQLTPHS